MKIGVISDTHSKALPKQLLNDFKDVNFVIHAGDICDLEAYQSMTKWKDLRAVYGNMDDRIIKDTLPRRLILDCENCRIGVFHGEGAPKGILDKVKNEFKGEKVDAVVFGHSHHPFNETIDNMLFFNPGSPNDEIFAPYRSYGILEVNENRVTGEIIKIKE